MNVPPYDDNVFINCPFDDKYKPLLNAVVFATFDCGFVPRCALEEDDGSQIRVQKILDIIAACRLSIHDLSRVEIDRTSKLPRFNMPLELGVCLGAKHFGDALQNRKACLILDTEKNRYQSFISDIAGQDIKAHNDNPETIISIVRNWLRMYSVVSIPSGSVIVKHYRFFMRDQPLLCKELKLKMRELIFNDYVLLVSNWLKYNA
jgi:hypothetical protein